MCQYIDLQTVWLSLEHCTVVCRLDVSRTKGYNRLLLRKGHPTLICSASSINFSPLFFNSICNICFHINQAHTKSQLQEVWLNMFLFLLHLIFIITKFKVKARLCLQYVICMLYCYYFERKCLKYPPVTGILTDGIENFMFNPLLLRSVLCVWWNLLVITNIAYRRIFG